MLDLIIFFILPVNVVLILSVVLAPSYPRFSFAYENKRANGGVFRNLHDDSPGDGVPVGEGVLAVDAVIFNGEMRDSHIHRTEKGKSPAHQERSAGPVNADWLLLTSSTSYVNIPGLVRPVFLVCSNQWKVVVFFSFFFLISIEEKQLGNSLLSLL